MSSSGELPLRGLVREEILADMAALPTDELRREAAKFLLRLKRNPHLGQPLENRAAGDLSDCRKIYFNEARHRIVYRLLPNEHQPQRVEIVAIGARAHGAVYRSALERLERD